MSRTPARLSAALLAVACLVLSGVAVVQAPQGQNTLASGCCSELN